VRLLLDEMISPTIAREFRARGHDVVAVENERPDLMSCADHELVRRLASEQRAIATNNVKDYRPIHDRFLGIGRSHHGMIFTSDDTLPRNKASLPLWVATLEAVLAAHPGDDALRNRVLLVP